MRRYNVHFRNFINHYSQTNKNDIMKTINYRGYTIEKQLTGWFTVFTSRYGYLKSDTLAGIKKMINHAIKAPQY